MTAEERRAARIKQIVDGWPPLTQRQVDQVSVLLWPDRTPVQAVARPRAKSAA